MPSTGRTKLGDSQAQPIRNLGTNRTFDNPYY